MHIRILRLLSNFKLGTVNERLTIVADKLEGLGQGTQQLSVDAACDADGGKGAVGGRDAVKGPRLGLSDEIFAVSGLRRDNLGNGREGGPSVVGAELVVSLKEIIWLGVLMVYGSNCVL